MNSKRYNLVMYQEVEIIKFLSACFNNRGKNISQVKYAYIYHDKDEKKPHYHLFIEFPEAVKDRDIERILTLTNISLSSYSKQKTNKNFLAYLTHSTPNDIGKKAPYEFNEIISNIDDLYERWQEAIKAVNTPSRQDKKIIEFTAIMKSLNEIIVDNNEIVSYSSLTMFLLENDLMEELRFCINKTYAIKEMFKIQFQQNSIHNASHSLKTKNQAKLHDLMVEYETYKKQNQQLDNIEENMEILYEENN